MSLRLQLLFLATTVVLVNGFGPARYKSVLLRRHGESSWRSRRSGGEGNSKFREA